MVQENQEKMAMTSAGNKKCDVLVVDTAGFIKNARLEQIGDEIVTLASVVSEIRDKATRERIKVTPYEMTFKEPNQEDLKLVTEFSRKTGDFGVLSAVDMRVLGLTLTMERRQNNGDISHLRTEPTIKATKVSQQESEAGEGEKSRTKLPGFYNPGETDSDEDEDTESGDEEEAPKEKSEEITEDIGELSISEKDSESRDGDGDASSEQDEDDRDDEDEGEEEAEEDDDEGWITPGNIKEKRKLIEGRAGDDDRQPRVKVACMTTDYAMQNVLKQMGLNVISVDGYLIKETRTWNLRCYACFTVTSDMGRKFCSKCGNKTLKRVSVTRNDDGSSQIHINYKRPINNRGKKFSLPKPKGGKKAVNPVLSHDQSGPQLRASKKALAKTNVFDSDYTAGESPFAKRDVTSKAALIGVPGMQTGQNYYWNKRNPNEGTRKTGNRKKT